MSTTFSACNSARSQKLFSPCLARLPAFSSCAWVGACSWFQAQQNSAGGNLAGFLSAFLLSIALAPLPLAMSSLASAKRNCQRSAGTSTCMFGSTSNGGCFSCQPMRCRVLGKPFVAAAGIETTSSKGRHMQSRPTKTCGLALLSSSPTTNKQNPPSGRICVQGFLWTPAISLTRIYHT